MKEMFEEYGGVMIAVVFMAVVLRMIAYLYSAYSGAACWFGQSLGNCV